VHARGARLFLDIPANHTGWASTLQEHRPGWFKRKENGAFKSPGAWGVVWEDLVELDYAHNGLRAHMAEVFLFWCRQGVDGFRCDAGYMVPQTVWTYVTARVREEYPDTVFLLEGLGGSVEVTGRLLTEANLDWAYSEIFQMETRADFEAQLPAAIALAGQGPLVHFAETHDNARLARRGHSYARLRTMLAALFSHHGAFGIANGAEWFATEQINVHNARPLNWGAGKNQTQLIRHLNTLLATHPAFAQNVALRLVHHGPGNVLALLREGPGNPLLVLANLGENAQSVSWDAAAFPPSQNCVDLLTLRPAPLSAATVDLLPMQVVCLSQEPRDAEALKTALDAPNAEPPEVLRLRKNLMAWRMEGACPHAPQDLKTAYWDYPADTRREVMIAPGHILIIRAPHSFRASVQTPRAAHEDMRPPSSSPQFSILCDDGTHTAVFRVSNDTADHLPLTLELHCFGVGKTRSPLLALAKPKHLRVKTTFTGAEVRERPNLCAILANPRGASAYVPAAWGELRSQYNALLALNLDPRVPVDKTIFLTRCRLWLRRGGYSTSLDKTCLKSFSSDPSGKSAQWCFDAPCGMGAVLPLTLALHIGDNRLDLAVVAGEPQGADAGETFRIVFRPDIEWRSFHAQTKAHAGPERDFPRAVTPQENGFVFAPDAGRPCSVFIEAASAAFHHEPEWGYQIFHPVEAQRGLEAHGDLFSPGWFHADVKAGETARVIAEGRAGSPLPAGRLEERLSEPQGGGQGTARPTIQETLRDALKLYIANRDDAKTVIAGFPWFLDWGRDTLIFLRGLIAAGETETALEILREFARFEEGGTLPNIIHGNTVGNRDTSDAPLWFIVALRDACVSTPSIVSTLSIRPLLKVCASILAHYHDGTANGIKMDAATGLVFSPAHFTWMDTNHPAATPREGYPVEIQALWIASLDFIAQHDSTRDWTALAQRARASFTRLFTLPNGALADCLRADFTPEDALRPNQLFAITLGVLAAPEYTLPILAATRRLLVPGAVRSLDDA
ncbi:MAG: glycogen debranching enzyme N-terminal domain-containing protein, partial [Kiritimatiellaeota bacterium]|nr:glycogen debranching enzyme N-terminal domain-containing protein [Kiritimatiellota bacterium]